MNINMSSDSFYMNLERLKNKIRCSAVYVRRYLTFSECHVCGLRNLTFLSRHCVIDQQLYLLSYEIVSSLTIILSALDHNYCS